MSQNIITSHRWSGISSPNKATY